MKNQLIFTAAPKPAEPFNAVAAYAGALINVLQRKIEETGELDTALADKIEGLLWPKATATAICSGFRVHWRTATVNAWADVSDAGEGINMEDWDCPAVAQGTPMSRDELFERFGKEFGATTWMAQKFVMGSGVVGDKEAYDVLSRVVEQEERTTMQLVAISVLSLANTEESIKQHMLPEDSPYRTVAYDDVLRAIRREIAERERAESAEAQVVELQKVLIYARGALVEVSPCMNPECEQVQRETLEWAIKKLDGFIKPHSDIAVPPSVKDSGTQE